MPPYQDEENQGNGANGGDATERTPFLGSNSTNGASSVGGKLKRRAASFGRALRFVITSNYVNVLLVFVPLGIIAGILGWSPTAVFILNFLAIIPLAALLSYATEEISLYTGQTLGGLLNATFGNAVELIVRLLSLINDCQTAPNILRPCLRLAW